MGTNENDRTFRCAEQARERGDALPGTASTARAFFLLEDWGPWGETAYLDARLPEGLGHQLLSKAREGQVRPLLIKQDRKPEGAPRRVFAGFVSATRCWVESAEIADPADALDIDFASLARGESTGMEPWDKPVVAVCTHSGHDICCAERGRPIVEHLRNATRAVAHDLDPANIWNVSHLGGDRFAGNMVIINQGLFFGGLNPESAEASVYEYVHGRLHLDYFRGHSFWKPVVQAAEIALRHELDHRDLAPLNALTVHDVDGKKAVSFEVPQGRFVVTMYRTLGEPALLTCRSDRRVRPGDWHPQSIERAS